MTDTGDPKVTYRMPRDRLERIDELAERHGVDRSEMLRRFDIYALEAQGEVLEEVNELEQLAVEREKIAKEGQDADRILGFPRRVENRLEDLFKDEWEPEKLRDSVKSYYREAENLEQQAEEHRDIESVESGEFVEAVDSALEETITAVHLSNWDEQDRYEKFDGVASGKQAERQALALTRTMMRRDQDLDALRSLSEANPRVEPEHAPTEARDSDLPEGVTLEHVAQNARLLVDEGLDPERLPLDPVGFREQAPEEVLTLLGEAGDDDRPEDALESGAVTVESKTDGGTATAVSDGGDHLAVQSFDGADEADGDLEEQDDDAGDEGHSMTDLVEEVAHDLREAENYSSDAHTEDRVERKREQKREKVAERIRLSLNGDTETWRNELMAENDLTADDLMELGDEYKDAMDAALRGDREDAPEVLVGDNGGVRIE